jgi:ABC-type polysaccharide/polyol phosphate export permease
VSQSAQIPSEPPAELIYRHKISLVGSIRDAWKSRLIVWALAERDLRARYKQSLLGFAWALITPLSLMIAFTLLFGPVLKIDTRGAPYPLFAYLGLLPWTFFTSAMSNGASSLIGNALLTKIPVAREVFPLSTILEAAFDSVLSVVALGVLFGVFEYAPRATSVWVPVLLLVQLMFTTGCVLTISVIVTYIRDLRQALPLMLQFGLFVTPVAFGLEVVSSSLRPLYCFLNPLGPVIDGYRRCVLYGQAPQLDLLALGAAGAAFYLTVGYFTLKKLEPGIADVS